MTQIQASPAAWAVTGLRRYVRWRAARQFHGWRFRADDLAALRSRERPLLFLANHTSWWDGFFALELGHRFGQAFYVMMQQDQLAAIPFFARCGAFSMDREHPRQAMRDLKYAASLLTPGHGVWVFPQGVRSPAGAPLKLEAGVGRLAAWAPDALIVPVAFRFGFVSEDLPEAFAWFGTPFDAAGSPEATMRLVEAGMTDTLARLDAALATTERAGFETLIEGAPSVNKRLDAFKAGLGLAPAGAGRNG